MRVIGRAEVRSGSEAQSSDVKEPVCIEDGRAIAQDNVQPACRMRARCRLNIAHVMQRARIDIFKIAECVGLGLARRSARQMDGDVEAVVTVLTTEAAQKQQLRRGSIGQQTIAVQRRIDGGNGPR